ncbi:MAG: selenocysteine-specific translation elongation factor [Methanotrichaceae archaeon]|nr:selenocysteine-specific translation elongation factor [Methanotrichaceae archaeon]
MEKKSFLLIFCGIPSSGKSQIALQVARNLEKRFEKPVIVVDTDSFRNMMPVSKEVFRPEREAFIRGAAFNTIALGLQDGYVVICDDLNYYVSMRKDLSAIAKNRGAGFGVVYINTPLATALKWNEKRGKPIPQELVEEINAKFEVPGKKYQWDSPIAIVDPSRESIEKATEIISEKTIQAMKVWGKPLKPPPEAPNQIRDLEKITRRAMGELMERFKREDLADQLSDLRRKVVKKALNEGLAPEAAVKLFMENSEEIISKTITKPEGKTFVHIGLFGHVDHGKTALARSLTEIPSTASLDRSPEAQSREMTIDMGFSSFMLKDYVVNLVDLPGHSTLIKHVTAGASIIDIGLLIVAADEGPMVQTLEHLRILENLEVKQILVVITKKDLASQDRFEKVTNIIRQMLEGTRFEKSRIIAVSSLKNEGIEDLKTALYETLTLPIRNWVGSFRMPVDHAFHIKGIGTVMTGTVLRGSIHVGDEVELQPIGKSGNVRSIQMFGTTVNEAKAGDRAGVAVSNIRPSEAFRGCELSVPGSLKPTTLLIVETIIDKNFGYLLKHGDRVHVNVGLQTVTASFIPFYRDKAEGLPGELNVALNSLKAGDKSLAFLVTDKEITAGKGDKLLMMKLDFQPKKSRVVGVAKLLDMPSSAPEFVTKKVRKGKVSKCYSSNVFIVQDLFENKQAAEHSVGRTVISESGSRGKISSAYSDKGEVLAEFVKDILDGEGVSIVWYRKLEI